MQGVTARGVMYEEEEGGEHKETKESCKLGLPRDVLSCLGGRDADDESVTAKGNSLSLSSFALTADPSSSSGIMTMRNCWTTRCKVQQTYGVADMNEPRNRREVSRTQTKHK